MGISLRKRQPNPGEAASDNALSDVIVQKLPLPLNRYNWLLDADRGYRSGPGTSRPHRGRQLSKWQFALKIIGRVFVSVLRVTDRWGNRSTGNHRQKESIKFYLQLYPSRSMLSISFSWWLCSLLSKRISWSILRGLPPLLNEKNCFWWRLISDLSISREVKIRRKFEQVVKKMETVRFKWKTQDTVRRSNYSINPLQRPALYAWSSHVRFHRSSITYRCRRWDDPSFNEFNPGVSNRITTAAMKSTGKHQRNETRSKRKKEKKKKDTTFPQETRDDTSNASFNIRLVQG